MPIYNPDTGQYEETEEEKRRRREAGTTEVGKQEITTYADGSQTRTVTQELPPAGPVAPVAPSMDMAAYNQRIAQMESGGRPSIGQHSPASSAYGTYGLTQAAYQDARRRNPNLPADIRQATPEQQTQAQTAFTQAQAGYLQNYGVPVNENTLAAAHFLGAKGLSDYMKTGYISPQAAAANGGEENVRRIVQQRLGGQMAPASAAQPAAQPQPVAPAAQPAQQPSQFDLAQGQGMPGLRMPGVQPQAQPSSAAAIDLYQQYQNNPLDLLKLRNDQSQPEFIRTRAADRAFELMDQERKKAEAEARAQDLTARMAQGDPRASREFSRAMTQRGEEGSYLKMMLLSLISPQLAGEEAVKLGFGNRDQVVTDASGNSYMVTFNAKGTPLRGYTADGQELTQKDLINVAGGAAGKLNVVGGTYVNDTTGEVGRVVTDEKTGRSYVQTDSGRKPLTGFRPQSSTGTLADQRTRQIQEINLRLQGKGVEEQMAILRDYNKQLAAAGQPIVQPGEVGLQVPQIAGGAAPAAAPASSRADQAVQQLRQGAAPAAPAAPGAAAPAVRPTGPQLAATAEARKTIAEAAGKVVADQGNMIADIESGNRAIDILNNKKTNFGAILQGILPGEQAVGKALGTQDARNTQQVMEVLDKVTAAGAKALGANPTDRDLQFLLGNRPNESWPAAEVANWIQRVQERTRANIEIARRQVESGGAYQPPVPQTGGTTGGSGKTSSGNTYRKL